MAPARAWAVGESITDVRILGNQRTEEDTVRSIAGVKIGDTLELDTLERVRERLNTAGLFADVNVWWEQNGEGVRVNIAVKDKFPWAPVPTASWSANNKSIGLVFVHGNLFGRGKQLVLGGRLADVDSGAVAGLPRSGAVRRLDLLAAAGQRPAAGHPRVRPTSVDVPATRRCARRACTSYGFETVVRHRLVPPGQDPGRLGLQKVNVGGLRRAGDRHDAPDAIARARRPGRDCSASGKASLSFDFRAREFAVMTGTALGGAFDSPAPASAAISRTGAPAA